MNMVQINYFLTTAKCLNFTEAATQLFISQPTLSRQINAMENELNLLLFMRDSHNVQLTPAGSYLFKELARLYDDYQKIISTARDENEGISATLNIGILDGHVVSDFLPKVLKSCFDKYPNIRINLSRGSFKSLTDGLYDKSLDVIITLYFDIAAKEKINFNKIKPTTDTIVMLKSHPLSNSTTVTFKDFKDDTFIFISPDDSAIAADNVINSCKSEGFYPKFKLAPNLETLMLWVESGIGVSVINTDNALINNPNLKMIPLGLDVPYNDTFLVLAWHNNNINPSIPIFMKETKPYLI